MRKVLIFDLGGVLVVNDMFVEFPKLSTYDFDENELKDKLLLSQVFRDFELGVCSADIFAKSMVGEFKLASTPDEFLRAFSDWPKGFYSGAEELLTSLRTEYSTACLSNSNELHWTSEVTSPFHYSYSSHLMNRIKPDKEVFDFVTTDIGCEPGEVIFFDDSRLNVDAANAFGWEAHLTVGYQELLRVLKKLEITQ